MKYLIFFLIFTVSIFSQNYTGTGTKIDPYILLTPVGVDSVRWLMSTGGAHKYFELGANMDMSSYANWIPIGEDTTTYKHFYDDFDGKHYTIKNLSITSPINNSGFYVGFFRVLGMNGVIDTSYIRNIIFDSLRIDITLSVAVTQQYIGALASSLGSIDVTDRLFIDSITVKNSLIRVTGREAHVGGLIGGINTAHARIYGASIESDSIVYKSAVNQPTIGGIVGTLILSTIMHSWVRNTYLYDERNAGTLGGFVGNLGSGSIVNSYVYNVEVVDNVTTDAAFALTGTFVGSWSGTIINSYAQGTTVYNANLSLKTGFAGYCIKNGTAVFFDSTVAGTSVVYLSGTGSASNVYPKPTDSMKVKTTYIWRGWDFTSIWSASGLVNNNYPNLEGIFYTGYVLNYPSAAGLVFVQDSVIEINWTTDVPDSTLNGTDTTFVWYALNGIWTLVDTVFNNDTSLSWIIPSGVYSTTGRVQLSNIDSNIVDTSNNFFTVIPLPNTFSALDIFNVTPSVFESGIDTAFISVETMNIDSFRTYWSPDSLTWYYVMKTIVDTTNGFFEDTTIVKWLSLPLIYGKVWLKSVEFRDTTLYYVPDILIDLNGRIPIYQNCYYLTAPVMMCGQYYYGVDSILLSRSLFDVSCGWNGYTTWRAYKVIVREDLTTGFPYYVNSYINYTYEQRTGQITGDGICDSAQFPLTSVYMVQDIAGDSTLFYDLGNETSGSSVVANNRRYYTVHVGNNYYVKVTDLLNSYTQTYIDYTNFSNAEAVTLGTYTVPMKTWQTYADTSYTVGTDSIPYYVWWHTGGQYDDVFRQRLLDSLGVQWGDYNRGYLLIGSAYGDSYSVSLLPEPVYQLNLAQDIWVSEAISKRNYFRGIYPKILK